jgi:transposase
MPAPRKYPKELIERGVRLAIESGRPVKHVAQDIGVPAETLRKAVRQAEADQGLRDWPTTAERGEIETLKRENAELRRANEILKAASVFFVTELDTNRPK